MNSTALFTLVSGTVKSGGGPASQTGSFRIQHVVTGKYLSFGIDGQLIPTDDYMDAETVWKLQQPHSKTNAMYMGSQMMVQSR